MIADVQKKKENGKSNAVNVIVAGVAGVIAGGVAIATAVAMSDKNNQKKVSDAVYSAKKKLQNI